jgi:hypothetical protein
MWAAGSGGLTLLGAIWIVVVVVVIVLAAVMIYWRFRRPSTRVHQESWRIRRIKEAASADVQEVLRDAKYFPPDAPGNDPDEL